MAACGATVAYIVVQLLQSAAVISFPLDEILIYGTSLCIVLPFLIEMLALHHSTETSRQFWTHGALILAGAYAIFVTSNYAVQLATVIPAKLRGPIPDIQLLDQTPHSLFWDYDALGYIFMGLAALFAVPAIGEGREERWVRRAMIAHALATPLIAIVYFYPDFSSGLLLFLGLPWAVTAPLFMLLLALMMRRRERPRSA